MYLYEKYEPTRDIGECFTCQPMQHMKSEN